MRRGGFTMIELIFVIVILGILAAVALPKFIGVTEQAKVGQLKGYVGTLNRTVAPTLWSKSLTDGNNGSIKTVSQAELNKYIDTLKSINDDGSDLTTPNLNSCGNSIAAGQNTVTTATIGGNTYNVGCRDGNATDAPRFYLDDGSNIILQ